MRVLSYYQVLSEEAADVAKLADALDLGSSAARHVGSTPIIRTKTTVKNPPTQGRVFNIYTIINTSITLWQM